MIKIVRLNSPKLIRTPMSKTDNKGVKAATYTHTHLIQLSSGSAVSDARTPGCSEICSRVKPFRRAHSVATRTLRAPGRIVKNRYQMRDHKVFAITDPRHAGQSISIPIHRKDRLLWACPPIKSLYLLKYRRSGSKEYLRL